ncbi:MAG TPA: tetratricopeptide repeat protein [Usitatibacteraceae bacterium]
MSLLLDALRRAEEAKRAKGQEGQPSGSASTPRTDAPLAFEELSLEDYGGSQAAALPPQPMAPKKPVPDFTKDVSPAQAVAARTSPQARPDAAVASPTTRLVRQDFSLRTDSPADEVAQREVAKSMFAAKQGTQNADRSTRGKWLLPLIAFLVVGLGGAGWYVWNEVTRLSRGASPTQPVRPLSIQTAPLPPTSQGVGQVGGKVPEPDVAKPIAQALPPLLPPPAREAPLPRVAFARPGVHSERAFSERELLARSLKDASSHAPKEAPISLRLSQNIDAPRINPDVLVAYTALTRGDYLQARQRYEQALQTEPLNLDAHLGLAAAAARMGENALAARHYRRALELDPRNGAALAGILAVSATVNPQAMETELKTLIAKDPDSAALQFSLGNLYAGDRRWSEAQQAYFEAYRLESGNADYRYNLAVALDHLQQGKLALDYYQKALVQAARSGAQFDAAAVQRRIVELKTP